MFWDVLGESWGRLGGILVRLGDVLGASWVAFGASLGHRGRLGGFLDRLVGVSWASWGVLGRPVLNFHAKTWLDLGMPV